MRPFRLSCVNVVISLPNLFFVCGAIMKAFFLSLVIVAQAIVVPIPAAVKGGDRVSSFPIVLRADSGSYFLTFYYQRGEKQYDYPRG